MLTFDLSEAAHMNQRIRKSGDLHRVMSDLTKALGELHRLSRHHPLALAAYAWEQFPGADSGTALTKFAHEMQTMAAAIDRTAKTQVAELNAAQRSKAGQTQIAFRRMNEINTELQSIDSAQKRGKLAVAERRATLRSAGISQDEIERLVPDHDDAELSARKAALEAEQANIQRFFRHEADTLDAEAA
ncbi:hypothetical protein [Halochromatium roseum]|uniref:hypothetical protein n=1 Tax=Halochromatium roseum TaxID=391920 RepID=UPI00191155EE|nr:hypothetical protein [Halochromatium roseum]MBK5938134.1 hypothetical protein [Halochromatium roseum]